MYLGVDYYPEHWPYEMIDEDLQRMKRMGCNIIRIGEFSWHLMEPTEGHYDFSFFDSVINKAEQYDLWIMFGTPTATFPAWLATSHSSILAQEADGRRRVFGGRRQYCYNSSVYRHYSRQMVNQLVAHYAGADSVIAWQIDNELGHEGSDQCYCSLCHTAFQQYLQNRYANDISLLNETYGTIFWGQTYNDFFEIPLPTHTITSHNPALRLDWSRFRSESIYQFAREQVLTVREAKGRHQEVTHNFYGGFFKRAYDQNRVAELLDFVSYDNYPVWGGLKVPLAPAEIAMTLDYARGLKQQHFWIVEQLMGAQGHTHIGYLPRPKQAQMWAYQAMSRGCDNMLFFRWRGMDRGAEQFCLGIIDCDNEDNRKYQEVKTFMEEVKGEESLSLPVIASVAVLYDFETIQSWEIQPQSEAFDYTQEFMRLYAPFHRVNLTTDVLSIEKCFSDYLVVVLPAPLIVDTALSERLTKYVEGGGVLIVGFRAGIKDRSNNLHRFVPTPYGITHLLGGRVRESESLGHGMTAPIINTLTGAKDYVTVWRDMIEPSTSTVLYRYADDAYESKACVTYHQYGKGSTYWIGAGVQSALLDEVIQHINSHTKLPLFPTPPGVERISRGEATWYINHNDNTHQIGEIVVKPYGVFIRRGSDETSIDGSSVLRVRE